MKCKLSTVLILNLSFCIFISFSYAYEGRDYFRERERVINKTLNRIELTLEFGFATQGEQSFELYNDYDGDGDLDKVSRLEYPHQGEMLILKGEVGFLSGFSIGGRFGSSSFSKRLCSDEDWHVWDPTWPYGTDNYVDYQITKQKSESKAEFFDVNLYYRLIDLDEDEVKRIRLSSEESTVFDYLMIDSLSLDVFAGYQQQKGRYRMIDPMTEYLLYDEGSWYYIAGFPQDIGLDSFYKIKYRGPRLGVRAEGSKGKFTTRVRLAYAWLKTKAYGWWNLRDLTFWQTGDEGYGIDTGFEVTYSFTPSLSAGLGYNYFYSHEGRLELSAIEAGTPWPAGAEVRNANSKIYGPSFILRYIW